MTTATSWLTTSVWTQDAKDEISKDTDAVIAFLTEEIQMSEGGEALGGTLECKYVGDSCVAWAYHRGEQKRHGFTRSVQEISFSINFGKDKPEYELSIGEVTLPYSQERLHEFYEAVKPYLVPLAGRLVLTELETFIRCPVKKDEDEESGIDENDLPM